jgi:sulfoacetaldehyde dehydrogenase
MSTPESKLEDSNAAEIVSALVDRARAAQAVYAGYNQHQVDKVVTAVGWTIMQPETNRRLSQQAVSDTGLGRVEDKITKNHRKTLGLLRDLKQAKTVGVVAEYPDQGLIEIARPVGVVGAVVPSTNPVATPYNKVLNSLKGGNAVILAPSPKGEAVAQEVVKLMREALQQVAAPVDLVQKLPAPVNKEVTRELMRQVDLLVVTGSQNNVRSAMTSGTPAIGVGAGNVPSVVDETADIEAAAQKITASKTFDNATSCSSENSLIIVNSVYDEMMAALVNIGARVVNPEEKERLRNAMWIEGRLSAAVTAKSAHEILDLAQIENAGKSTTMVLVEEDQPDKSSKFCDEKLSPVLTVFRACDFDEAVAMVDAVLDIRGKGHSVSLHSTDDNRALQMGLTLPVCRVIRNQAHCFATGGSFDNGLPFSLSMGCGTWGGNIISDNMNYRHYLNTTRIAAPIPSRQPGLKDLFGDFWDEFGINPKAHGVQE